MLLMLAEPGLPLERAGHFRRSVAGAESNVASGLARLGHWARWIGRVGDDPAGEAVLRELRADGVDVSCAEMDPEAPTGLLLRDSHPQRAIDVQYYRTGSAASLLSPAQITPEALAGVRVVHVSGITPMLSPQAEQATHALVERARQAGAAVCFDPNVRRKLGTSHEWIRRVGPLLREADIVLAGEDELELLLGTGEDEGAKALLTMGRADCVVVKRRDHSAVAHTAEGQWTQQPFAVRVADPVGAGDAFAAGWLSARLRGLDHPRALAEAACVAALVVQAPGDTDGLPTAAARDRALDAFLRGTDSVHR
ncbi:MULTISPECIES: sugar kinase [Streptomyces]|uniref:Ribokinase n=1 Tax=Streptomyces cacaoi TaxID=1898 RepID=A0A4Y3RA54_STRCI|nr:MULTISPECIES: sugar kinase [Streptomyces]NNG89438.1 sugar kinase [Streptomyces cacaoi]QHF96252.1 sugar kinase [Streptomyces sp. NHF165]GEB54344.1 ribokinase [Streptomyces cacaoi]